MAAFKRKVLYLGGFDPRGVRFYHQLYREQLARYAHRSGDVVEMTARSQPCEHVSQWQVSNATQPCETTYEFLRWEDVVNQRWERNPLRLAWLVVRTYAAILRDGDWAKARTLPRGPFITLAYPLLLTVLVPAVQALLFVWLIRLVLPGLIAAVAGIVLAAVVSLRLLDAIKAPWLLRFFTFNHALAGPQLDAELDARLDLFAERLAAALDEPWDEVLFISHSNGAILALPLLQRLTERRASPLPPHFAFITLGHSIPLLAARRRDNPVRAALRALAPRSDLNWVDIGSPPDGAGFHGVDCYALIGIGAARPATLLSPRFHVFYDAATYHQGLHNKYEIHFDYLRVADRLSPLDYISITASPRPLAASISLFQAIP